MPQITLRNLHANDSDSILKWRNSPTVSDSMYGDHIISDTEHRLWFDSLSSDDTKRYWMIESDKTPIGVSYIYDIDQKNRHASWGFYIVENRSRRIGVGYYVEVFMLYFAFEHLNLRKLNCEVLFRNSAVWKMHEKIGFKREGLFHAHIKKAGAYHDVVRLALLQSEWALLKETHINRLSTRGQQLPEF